MSTVPARVAAVVAVAAALLTACDPAAEPQSAPSGTGPTATSPASPSPATDLPSPTTTATATGTPSPAAVPRPSSAPPAPTPNRTTAVPAPQESGQDAGQRDGTRTVTAFYVRPGGGTLWVEPERRRLDQPTLAVATAALRELLQASPRAPGLRPVVPEPVRVLGVSRRGGTLRVNLDPSIRRPALGGAAEQALQQAIAHTGAQFPTVDRVRVLLGGRMVESVWGHAPWSEPLEPDLFALSPIDITRPAPGARVTRGPLTVAGTANTFEATVKLALRDPRGKLVEQTFATASCGTGCRGRFRHNFDTRLNRLGTWTIVASEPDPSGGEGRSPFVTRRQVEVVR